MSSEGRGVDHREFLVLVAARLPGPQELDALYEDRRRDEHVVELDNLISARDISPATSPSLAAPFTNIGHTRRGPVTRVRRLLPAEFAHSVVPER
jgi:hypothetical protein